MARPSGLTIPFPLVTAYVSPRPVVACDALACRPGSLPKDSSFWGPTVPLHNFRVPLASQGVRRRPSSSSSSAVTPVGGVPLSFAQLSYTGRALLLPLHIGWVLW